MATDPTEIELRFQVPAASRAALLAELQRGPEAATRQTLAAAYIDTPQRRLAKAGMAWRVRREGRRWVQTLKAGGSGGGADAFTRFEHEVIRPDASFEASLHAGTPAGERLLAELARAAEKAQQPAVRFRTQVRRITRRIRTRGAVVELAFDEGHLIAGEDAGGGERRLKLRELEFELVSGSAAAMLALTERWRQRFALVFEPRSKAERGDRLASGQDQPGVRKAAAVAYGQQADAGAAFIAMADECLDQITRNALGLAAGDPALAADHVHQLRVGIRRLRSALRVFRGWVTMPPQALVEGLQAVFADLGQSRDQAVLVQGVAQALAAAGAPPMPLPAPGGGPDPAARMAGHDAQQLMLSWMRWRLSLQEPSLQPEGQATAHKPGAARFHRKARARLRRWHQRLARDAAAFDQLPESALHALRKRIKRQRYALECFGPWLGGGDAARYRQALRAVQAHMGELNDLLVAVDHYRGLVDQAPTAWFALGWLAARVPAARSAVRPALQALARTPLPSV